jgi:hypothetical protein
MRIADCGMRTVKGYNSEIRNPKSEIWMADASGVPLGAGPFPSGPLSGFHKIFRSTNLEMIDKEEVDKPGSQVLISVW